MFGFLRKLLLLDRAATGNFLARLSRNVAGNTMAITAIAIIPLMGMAGGALDVSRIYLSRVRLQQACDASVLAYRRSMNGTNVTSDTEPTARNFFNANYSAGRYGSGTPTVSFSVDSQVVVHGTANVTVPMSVMAMFGFHQVNLEATCDAQLQLPNTDVMFVLDTTGSMTDTNPGDSVNKITALRGAVMSFYDTLEAAKISGTQLRYGFVPYSNSVNVGTLLKREWMVDSATYQSKVWDHQEIRQTGTTSSTTHTYSGWTPDTYTITYDTGDPENCVAPSNTARATNTSSSAWTPSSTALPRTRTNYRTLNGTYYSAATQSNGTCRITVKTYNSVNQSQTETYDTNPNGGTPVYTTYNYWRYEPVTYDVTALKGSASSGLMAGGSFTAYLSNPSGSNTTASGRTITWNASSGCIEERKTLRSGETGGTGEPFDENIDLVPTSDPNTQWRPLIPALVYARNVGSYSGDASTWNWNYGNTAATTSGYVNLSSYPYDRAACPSIARKLQSSDGGLTRGVLQSYINGLKTGGDTYHDIGFLWGLRLASAQGLFASENSTAPNGFDISRNIIFMTDGQTESHIQDYDAYGLSALDRRRTSTSSLPTDTDQNSIVEERLTQYCNAAKGKGFTVWVIAFGTDLTSLLSNCASSGRSYQANNADQLNAAFADIASRIAQLRLTR